MARRRRERTFAEKYAPRTPPDPDTPRTRAWAAWRRLVGIQDRLENETSQSLRDTIEAEGFNAYELALEIVRIRRPHYGPQDEWLASVEAVCTHPGLKPGERARPSRQPGEDG